MKTPRETGAFMVAESRRAALEVIATRARFRGLIDLAGECAALAKRFERWKTTRLRTETRARDRRAYEALYKRATALGLTSMSVRE